MSKAKRAPKKKAQRAPDPARLDLDLGLDQAPVEPAKRGRPEFKPTLEERRLVTALAAFGIPEKEIAALVRGGISNNTLRKHFDPELETGTARAVAKVAQTLFTKATSPELSQPSVTAAIFFLKARGKWKDTQTLEVTDPNGVLLASFKAAVTGVVPGASEPAGDGSPRRTH